MTRASIRRSCRAESASAGVDTDVKRTTYDKDDATEFCSTGLAGLEQVEQLLKLGRKSLVFEGWLVRFDSPAEEILIATSVGSRT